MEDIKIPDEYTGKLRCKIIGETEKSYKVEIKRYAYVPKKMSCLSADGEIMYMPHWLVIKISKELKKYI